MKFKSLFVTLTVSLLICCGCGQNAPSEPSPMLYTVRYYAENELIGEESLSEGQLPSAVPTEVEDGRILRWLDAGGEEQRPGDMAVYGDMEFHAETAPSFDRHVPYLFTDDYGLLHPDEAFTLSQLEGALKALAGEAQAHRVIIVYDKDLSLNAEAMKYHLSAYFPAEELTKALEGFGGQDALSRADAACIFHKLLGRETEDSLVAEAGARMIPDLYPQREDYEILLEAALPHYHRSGVNSFTGLPHEAAFLNIDGALYCINEEGYLLRDESLGSLYFGPDGAYTSGSEELDAYVESVLAEIIAADPDGQRLDWLRGAYDYTRDSFTYLRRNYYITGHTDWEMDDALVMFDTQRGNCYNYAAVFWSLARGLGYEARAVAGTINENAQPHGWVIISMEDGDYYFDPEIEMTFVIKGQTIYDLFMMSPYEASAWYYIHY